MSVVTSSGQDMATEPAINFAVRELRAQLGGAMLVHSSVFVCNALIFQYISI